MIKNKLSVKEQAKVLWENHKEKIIAAGIFVGMGVLVLITIGLNTKKKEEEVLDIPAKEPDYSIHWFQGDDEGSGLGWTLDLPVHESETVKSALLGALDDLESGKFHEVEL